MHTATVLALLPVICLTALALAEPSRPKGNKNFFGALDAEWTAEKGGYERQASRDPAITLPLGPAWNDRITRSIGATPAAADSFIFISTRDRRVFILNYRTGRKVKEKSYKGGFGGSVLIRGPMMYFSTRVPDGRAYAVEINSGEKQLEKEIGPSAVAPILAGNQLVIFTQYGKVVSINPEEGDKNWEAQLTGKVEYAPVLLDPFLYVATLDGAVHKIDVVTGRVQASRKLEGHLLGDLASDGESIFCALVDGRVFRLDPDSLALRWQVKLDREFFSGPVVDHGSLYLSARRGKLVKLSAADGATIWEVSTGGVTVAAPSIAAGMVFIGTKTGELSAFDSRSGERVWYTRIGEGISASPLIYREYVYYCTDRGAVYAFKQQEDSGDQARKQPE